MLEKPSENYNLLMNEIKQMNRAYKEIVNSKGYKLQEVFAKFIKRDINLNYIQNKFINLWAEIRCKIMFGNTKVAISYGEKYVPDYCFPHRIAVYTCVLGSYDKLQEPFIIPDNCDFYVYCDSDYEVNSHIWQKRDINNITDMDAKLSPLEKSRFVKMCPHILFPEYEYSFYVDANVKIMIDISEYMHYIGQEGISMHQHYRNCVYKEAKAITYYHKAPKQKIAQCVAYLLKNGMPENYGMVSCGIIARCHHNPVCIRIMDEWWKIFRENVHRDQMWLPYILFKQGINIENIATMPSSFSEDESFIIYKHMR